MMGRGLERLAQVPAGNVLAIGGLDTAILKSATLSNSPIARPLAPMLFQARNSTFRSCPGTAISIFSVTHYNIIDLCSITGHCHHGVRKLCHATLLWLFKHEA